MLHIPRDAAVSECHGNTLKYNTNLCNITFAAKFGGSVGVLHVVQKQADMEFFTKDSMPSPPYAPVLTPHLFTRENVMKFKALGPDLISVLVLINDFSKVTTFSHESTCPNQYSGYARDGQCNAQWNPVGTGLLLEDFPFPIYFVNDQPEIEKIFSCTEKFNNFDLPGQKSRSLCSIEVDSVMSGAVNSEVCMRRSEVNAYLKPITYCDPLQGRNVYATLFPREIVAEEDRVNDPKERFIMVTARLDTTTMFDGIGVGAMGSLVSFATLLSTAHILSKLLPPGKRAANSPNVLFALFNGESYDYIGSQRMVYDMEKGDFPIRRQQTRQIQLSNIDLLLDIGTLDSLNQPDLYSLKDAEHKKNIELRELMAKYNKINNSNYFNVTTTAIHTDRIPPTSANTFLQANRSMPVVIMSSKPSNLFLHSIYDTHLNINFEYKNISTENFLTLSPLRDWTRHFNASDVQMGIRNLSTVLAYSLYEMVTEKTWIEPTEGGNPYLVDEFLFCWLFSAKCRLLYSAVWNNYTLSSHHPLRYISIDRSHSIQSIIWTYDLMGLLIGEQQQALADKETCKPLPYRWYPGYEGTGVCIRTTQNYSAALSPAFRVPDYDWKSGQYSTWTESTWNAMSARIFLRPSAGHEALTLTVGFVVIGLSFVIVYLVNKKTDVLFGNCASSEA